MTDLWGVLRNRKTTNGGDSMMSYEPWTSLRLLHYWFWQPQWEDRQGVKEELEKRGLHVSLGTMQPMRTAVDAERQGTVHRLRPADSRGA